ncbi:MAG: helix-turn-helix domain-containing protein [Prevotella sp.]
MDSFEQMRKLNMYDVYYKTDADYIDENIALYMNIKDIPVDNEAVRLDMYVILACIHGRMEVSIDSIPYTIAGNDVIMCLPTHLVNNCLVSPDFEGMVLCVSLKALKELVNEKMLWERGLKVMNSPLIHILDDSAHDLMEYSRAVHTAIHSSHKPFRRQIIMSLVRACVYELMSNIDISESDSMPRLTRKDYLFRSFLELMTGLDVKPRTVQWYADKLNVSSKYLSTVCKEVSGRTAFQWICESVEKDITCWLQNSNLSIKEIVNVLQFPNNSFFGKYCRQHFGMSPTEYREHLRRNSED